MKVPLYDRNPPDNAIDLLAKNPRIFWGKVIWLLIQRGWRPPPPDEKAVDDLLDAFSRVGEQSLDPRSDLAITKRQGEILTLIADGHTNDEIAAILGIAPQTVKFHITDLLARMDARSRAHAVSLGFRAGFLG